MSCRRSVSFLVFADCVLSDSASVSLITSLDAQRTYMHNTYMHNNKSIY